jgi:hypothetical protein
MKREKKFERPVTNRRRTTSSQGAKLRLVSVVSNAKLSRAAARACSRASHHPSCGNRDCLGSKSRQPLSDGVGVHELSNGQSSAKQARRGRALAGVIRTADDDEGIGHLSSLAHEIGDRALRSRAHLGPI